MIAVNLYVHVRNGIHTASRHWGLNLTPIGGVIYCVSVDEVNPHNPGSEDNRISGNGDSTVSRCGLGSGLGHLLGCLLQQHGDLLVTLLVGIVQGRLVVLVLLGPVRPSRQQCLDYLDVALLSAPHQGGVA